MNRPKAIIQVDVSNSESHDRHKKFTYFPNTEQPDENVIGKTAEEHLREDEDIGRQGGLQHDWHIGSVEEFDGVGSALSTEPVRLYRDLNTESLEVDDGGEDDGGGNEIHDVRKTSTPKGLTEGATLVIPGEEEMEEGDESTLEFWSTAGVDGGRRESLPYDGLANVGGDEERDT